MRSQAEPLHGSCRLPGQGPGRKTGPGRGSRRRLAGTERSSPKAGSRRRRTRDILLIPAGRDGRTPADDVRARRTGRASAGAARGSPPEDDNVHGRSPGLRVVAGSRGLPGEPGHQWHSFAQMARRLQLRSQLRTCRQRDAPGFPLSPDQFLIGDREPPYVALDQFRCQYLALPPTVKLSRASWVSHPVSRWPTNRQ
jgi:hypothetical protein